MSQKIEAHDTLPLMFKWDGVPSKMIVDNSKEQYLGEFISKCGEFEYNLVNSKPYLTWSQMSEGCIQELNRVSSRQYINVDFLKRMWNHCIELQALICSHIAHSNYELDCEVKKNCMTGQIADIGNICQYSWFEQVMFCDQPITYPN